jgi:hypothetical protein
MTTTSDDLAVRVAELEARVDSLEARFAVLERGERPQPKVRAPMVYPKPPPEPPPSAAELKRRAEVRERKECEMAAREMILGRSIRGGR